jgi:hypothetical protein
MNTAVSVQPCGAQSRSWYLRNSRDEDQNDSLACEKRHRAVVAEREKIGHSTDYATDELRLVKQCNV